MPPPPLESNETIQQQITAKLEKQQIDTKIQSEKALLDPWEHPYNYKVKNTYPIISSNGPDEIFGTSDDIILNFR